MQVYHIVTQFVFYVLPKVDLLKAFSGHMLL